VSRKDSSIPVESCALPPLGSGIITPLAARVRRAISKRRGPLALHWSPQPHHAPCCSPYFCCWPRARCTQRAVNLSGSTDSAGHSGKPDSSMLKGHELLAQPQGGRTEIDAKPLVSADVAASCAWSSRATRDIASLRSPHLRGNARWASRSRTVELIVPLKKELYQLDYDASRAGAVCPLNSVCAARSRRG